MKKIMNVIIVFSVVILCAPVSNVYADDDSDYTVKNSEALKIFNELNQEKQAQKRTITQSNESTIEKITNIASSSYD